MFKNKIFFFSRYIDDKNIYNPMLTGMRNNEKKKK